LLRRFFPKGNDFNDLSQKQIDAKVRLINEKPRRILGYRSALEVAREGGII
jgi:IS30 family transposase